MQKTWLALSSFSGRQLAWISIAVAIAAVFSCARTQDIDSGPQAGRRELGDSIRIGDVELTVVAVTKTDDGFELEYAYRSLVPGQLLPVGQLPTADGVLLDGVFRVSTPDDSLASVPSPSSRLIIPASVLDDGSASINFGYFTVFDDTVIGHMEIRITDTVVTVGDSPPSGGVWSNTATVVNLVRNGVIAQYFFAGSLDSRTGS